VNLNGVLCSYFFLFVQYDKCYEKKEDEQRKRHDDGGYICVKEHGGKYCPSEK